MKTYILMSLLVLSLIACKTTKSYLKDAKIYADNGDYCQALQVLYETNPSNKNKLLVQNTMNLYGNNCIESQMNILRQQANQPNNSVEWLNKLYENCMAVNYNQNYINNQIRKKEMHSTVVWKEDYEQLRLDIYHRITDEKYKIALYYYNNTKYDKADIAFGEVLDREENYKDARIYREKSYNAYTKELYEASLVSYQNATFRIQFEDVLEQFDKILKRQRYTTIPYKQSAVLHHECYNKITELYYQETLKAYQQANSLEQFKLVLAQLNNILKRNYYSTAPYKQSAVLHHECYNKITELYYQEAVYAYHQAQSIDDFENVMIRFEAILNRTNYSNVPYKESLKYRQECYAVITSIHYDNARELMASRQWENAFHAFEVVINRENSSYKDAYKLRRFCYNEWTRDIWNQANMMYHQHKFRLALQQYRFIKTRQHYYEVIAVPYLEGQMTACLQYGSAVFFFNERNTHKIPELIPLIANVQNAFRDEFIRFSANPLPTAHSISVSIKYTYSDFQNQDKPHKSQLLQDIYEVKSYQIIDTTNGKNIPVKVSYTEPVKYYKIQGEKTIQCIGYYKLSINNSFYYNNLQGAFSDSFKASYTSSVDYYELEGQGINLDNLTRQFIPKEKAMRFVATDKNLAKLFENKDKRVFENETLMEETVRIKVIQQIERAIIQDIQQIQRNIQ